MFLFVQGPFSGNQVPEATIQGQARVLRMSSSAIFGQGHSSMRISSQVRVLELRRMRCKQDLQGLEVSLRPDFALPDPLVAPTMDDHEILQGPLGQDLGHGLQACGDTTLQVHNLAVG